MSIFVVPESGSRGPRSRRGVVYEPCYVHPREGTGSQRQPVTSSHRGDVFGETGRTGPLPTPILFARGVVGPLLPIDPGLSGVSHTPWTD